MEGHSNLLFARVLLEGDHAVLVIIYLIDLGTWRRDVDRVKVRVENYSWLNIDLLLNYHELMIHLPLSLPIFVLNLHVDDSLLNLLDFLQLVIKHPTVLPLSFQLSIGPRKLLLIVGKTGDLELQGILMFHSPFILVDLDP